MTRVIYTGMDVHKDTYSLCSFDAQDNVIFSETTVKAETASVVSYIKSIDKRYSDDDVMIVYGYEEGQTRFSLCIKLQKNNITCVIMTHISIPNALDDNKRKTDKGD